MATQTPPLETVTRDVHLYYPSVKPAEYNVTYDRWGYIVTPAEEDLFSNNLKLEITNSLKDDVTVSLHRSVEHLLTPSSAKVQTIREGDTAVFEFTRLPDSPFSFYCLVEDGHGFRARAKSDPRVNPRG